MSGPTTKASAIPASKSGSRSAAANRMADATAKAKADCAPQKSGSRAATPKAGLPKAGSPPHFAQTGLPLSPPFTPPASVPKGIFERAREAFNKASAQFQQDVKQEIVQDIALIQTLPAATAVTYEHKQGVVKTDITVLGNGVTLETGTRWSGTWRLDGKYQAGVKRYGSAAVTVTFPKTKIIGGGPYVEAKGEIAGTGDISFKEWPPKLNSANIDARAIGKGAAGVQGSLLGQSAKLYVQGQGGVRAGAGINRPFDLAPDTVGTYIVGEAGNHVVKLKIPFMEMMSLSPQAVATRLFMKGAQRAGEALHDVWKSATQPAPKPAPRAGSRPATPAPVTPRQPQPCPTPTWQKPPASHTVKSGDTMWDIAKAQSGGRWTWQDLAKANADIVKNPDLIYPGQVLRFPQK